MTADEDVAKRTLMHANRYEHPTRAAACVPLALPSITQKISIPPSRVIIFSDSFYFFPEVRIPLLVRTQL